jgi:hypothetical protein
MRAMGTAGRGSGTGEVRVSRSAAGSSARRLARTGDRRQRGSVAGASSATRPGLGEVES